MEKELKIIIEKCPQNHKCPAIKVCPVGALSQDGFNAPKIDYNKCIKCGACAASCPVSCISEVEERYEIDPNMCIECGTCAGVCPVDAPELD